MKKQKATSQMPESGDLASPTCEEQLQSTIIVLEEKNKRMQADFQNARRRLAEEKTKFLQFANQDVIERLLQPLEHLSLAAEQLNDHGLNLVIEQFWQSLQEIGLTEIPAVGQAFDVETMEAVETGEKGTTVVKLVKRGYKLHDKVIQHAKVILD